MQREVWQPVIFALLQEWAVGVGEDGKVGVYGDVTVGRSGSGMLDGSWNFSWDECGVSDKEDTEVGEVMSLVGLADDIWSKVEWSKTWILRKKSWRKGGDAVNVCDFDGAVRDSCKKCFGLKGVAAADSDWDEDDWESVQTERRFNLEDGGGDLIKGDCDKDDDDDDDDYDDCGNNASCSVSMIKSEYLMFPFSVMWGDLYNTFPCLESYLAKSSPGLGAWKSFFFIFAIVSQIIIGLINFYSSRRPMNVSW